MLPTHYKIEIKIQEKLTRNSLVWFEDMFIQDLPENGSLISGTVTDQAAVHGVIERIRDLSLTLVSIQVAQIQKEI